MGLTAVTPGAVVTWDDGDLGVAPPDLRPAVEALLEDPVEALRPLEAPDGAVADFVPVTLEPGTEEHFREVMSRIPGVVLCDDDEDLEEA